ncbi:MAG: hypothetical protein RL095_2855 [Verrucomicrobiota bacterium]|jgi:GNAT superfamily N-acetyltransferase
MSVVFPAGYRLVPFSESWTRRDFSSGNLDVDRWLKTQAKQAVAAQHMGVRLLVQGKRACGFYALKQIALVVDGLPQDLLRRKENAVASATLLAWIGVDRNDLGQGLGTHLLAQALNDALQVHRLSPGLGVIVDALSEELAAKYRAWGFKNLPDHPLRLILPAAALIAMADEHHKA